MNKTRRNVFLALLTAAALIISIIENMIPLPFIAPGAKLGLANIISLTVLVVFGLKYSIIVTILRCILFMLTVGNPISFIYSIVSSLISVIVMYIVYRFLSKLFSLIGVSVFGALTHNTCQVLVASIIMSTKDIFMYLPVMYIISIFTGCFVGMTAQLISEKLLNHIGNNNINRID